MKIHENKNHHTINILSFGAYSFAPILPMDTPSGQMSAHFTLFFLYPGVHSIDSIVAWKKNAIIISVKWIFE